MIADSGFRPARCLPRARPSMAGAVFGVAVFALLVEHAVEHR